jgi:hypothetical protein
MSPIPAVAQRKPNAPLNAFATGSETQTPSGHLWVVRPDHGSIASPAYSACSSPKSGNLLSSSALDVVLGNVD